MKQQQIIMQIFAGKLILLVIPMELLCAACLFYTVTALPKNSKKLER